MAGVRENIYLGSNNEIKLTVSNNGELIDFATNGVTSMIAYIDDIEINSIDGLISYEDGGVITLTLGGVDGIESGKNYYMAIKAFDASHPDGQVIVHPKMSNSNVLVTAYELDITG